MKNIKLRKGATTAELILIGMILAFFASFLLFHGLQIKARVEDRRCVENLKAIGLALHIYAHDEAEQSFPKDDTAEAAFRRIFVRGNIIDPRIFDCPSRPGHPHGKPGPDLRSPSPDLTGVEYLYGVTDLSLNSPSSSILVTDRPGNHPGARTFHVLHVDGTVSTETAMPAGPYR